ncbi:tail tube protein [Bacillus phage vB_Bacillus_1020A]|uniref:phage tail assembly chaperone G n=1 Tax=Robertmurraya sp. DFI.2.37 TaxID=3031819 RepID=UPI00124930A9|nr:hypothetical protein [Robertmurraya sp. DFI.2.37]MDF1510825.1 hypothetical protein [Robertmurraya sp. DFI.2.37]QIW89306.1 tail tube protein [Bacillus phage vB_Bacillus_1020A]
MKIELIVDGENKTFAVPFVKGRILRRALKLNKLLEGKTQLDDETIDNLAEFVCEVFENQFTVDELLDGLPLKGMLPKLQGTLVDVITEATSGIEGVSDSKNN